MTLLTTTKGTETRYYVNGRRVTRAIMDYLRSTCVLDCFHTSTCPRTGAVRQFCQARER